LTGNSTIGDLAGNSTIGDLAIQVIDMSVTAGAGIGEIFMAVASIVKYTMRALIRNTSNPMLALTENA
jgi:hypothetical protein